MSTLKGFTLGITDGFHLERRLPGYWVVTIVERPTFIMDERGWMRQVDSKKKTMCIVTEQQLDRLHRVESRDRTLPGRIVTCDYVESAVPKERYMHYMLDISRPDAQLHESIRRDPNTGRVLTLDGERIMRLTHYDPTGLQEDIILEPNN